MYGKLLGAGVGACAAMLLEWDAPVVVVCLVAGTALGHLLFDRERPLPRAEQPRSVEELLSEGRERRAREKARKPAPAPRKASAEQQALVDALCPLFIEVARADGDVVGDEVRTVREFFESSLGFDEPGLEAVRLALKAALAVPATEVDVEALVKANRGAVKPGLRVQVLRAMYEVALADGAMKRAEQDTLKRVVQHFNLSEEQLQQVTREFFGAGLEHFAALGLDDTASDDDIRSAFRRLAAENHPDRVASEGPAAAEAAAERFRKVKDAFEALKQLRGL